MSDAVTQLAEPGLKGEVTTLELSRSERTAARRSAESRATVPHLELSAVASIGPALGRTAAAGTQIGAFVIVAVAHALGAVPRVNGSYRDGRCELYSRVNIGVTLLEQGLTPTIFDADRKQLTEIAGELADLRARAGEDQLRPGELTGATFTVVDATAYDIVTLAPVVPPSQAGALAFGPIREAAVVRDGIVAAGRTITLSLAADNRIVDGHHGGAFLADVKSFLEEADV